MSIAVVTSIFNCLAGSVRHRHYDTFKNNLNIPLYTIELAFEDYPFVLKKNDQVTQIRCKTWLWQRDRILNHLIDTIPDKYDNIALVDADILFHDNGWHKDAEGMLRECQVGQLWARCHHTYANVPMDYSISNRDKNTVHTGYAWAAKRSFLEKFGLFDRSPVGGNDVFMTAAYCGWREHPYFLNFTPVFMEYFSKWASKVFETTHGNVGYVNSDITHLWHGARINRNYMSRLELMKDLDPEIDLEIDESGCWRWATDKPDMHKGIEKYIRSRIEG